MQKTRPKFIALIPVLLFFASILSAQDPGTVGDPLISKSYIDQFFKFRSMVIPGRDKLQLSFGALLILRSGSLQLRCPKGKTLIDLTNGSEVKENSQIPANHLLIVPDSSEYYLEATGLSMILVSGLRITHGN
ncbi:MAG: hypothetical protein HQM08_00485 [Candidatus Riflebacteria bacterium]|nr:hypothetical protein [Candidatus Riflebacteria bacterium]